MTEDDRTEDQTIENEPPRQVLPTTGVVCFVLPDGAVHIQPLPVGKSVQRTAGVADLRAIGAELSQRAQAEMVADLFEARERAAQEQALNERIAADAKRGNGKGTIRNIDRFIRRG